MDAVNEAVKKLKYLALKEKDKELAERVDSLAITLRLLVSSLDRILRTGPLTNFARRIFL